MPGAQVPSSVTILNSLKGFQGISFTNFATSALSQIAAGSVVEIAGAFFNFPADETINASTWTSIASGNTAYIVLVPAGTAGSQTVTAEYTATVPVWRNDMQGWYASAASVARVVASLTKQSSTAKNGLYILYDNVKASPKGYQAISLTNFQSSALSLIAAGSQVEINGFIHTFPSDTAIGNWAAITTGQTGYIALTPAGITATPNYTATPPVWSESKQGWYASAGSSTRVIGSVYKVSATAKAFSNLLGKNYTRLVLPSDIIKQTILGPVSTLSGITFANGNIITCSASATSIYKHAGISSTITSVMSTPSSNITGIAFDGVNLISCDGTSDLIYKHSGISSTITSTYTTPATSTIGVAIAEGNLISASRDTDLIYIHSGITSAITSFFQCPGFTPKGLAYDGKNLISGDSGTNVIYIHDGVSPSIILSITQPGVINGQAFTGLNLISATRKFLYVHSSQVNDIL
jgi:hypothetical protein